MEINENLELFTEDQTNSMIDFSHQKLTILQAFTEAQRLHTKLANSTETISILQNEFYDRNDCTELFLNYKTNLERILLILNQKIINSRKELTDSLDINKPSDTLNLHQF